MCAPSNSNTTKPSSHQYSLFGHPLSKVASHSYLGVKLDSKLSWAKHITEITSKSSKVLGMVKRTLGPCKPEVKDTAYNMLVRPKLEYASPIWNPHKSSQISRLERIQQYAARFVANDHRRTTSPTTLVLTLIIAHILTKFYNVSVETETVISDWKLSKVTPIYKGNGSKDEAGNYRPISLSSV